MEPRPHERGNRRCPCPPSQGLGGFNGATSSRTWKHYYTPKFGWQVRLQWSHVLTNVETMRLIPLANVSKVASMEPRPHERGNVNFPPVCLPVMRFNGATSSRTWKRAFHRARSLCRIASMEPRPHERGNSCLKEASAAAIPASMEPRPHERGNQGPNFGKRQKRSSFNGATSSRTWKRRSDLCRRECSGRFNGATSSRTWKPEVMRLTTPSATVGFNGATSSRTWKQGSLMASSGVRLVLQWSHVLTNVETALKAVEGVDPEELLQWSHVLTNVETHETPGIVCQASRKLQWSHVLTNVET